MSSISLQVAPVNANGDALAALERIMISLDYCARARSDAKTIVRRTGCVADCVPSCLEPHDLATVEAVYVAALPAVDFNDDAWWNDSGSLMTIDDILDAAAGHYRRRFVAITPPELDDPFGDDIPFLAAV